MKEDIYKNQKNYEYFLKNYRDILTGIDVPRRGKRDILLCKNTENIKYFEYLFKHFDAEGKSYVGRKRWINTLKLVVAYTEKDLKDLEPEDFKAIMPTVRARNKTADSYESFTSTLIAMWRVLFPELDARGRPDPKLLPYSVSLIPRRLDKSTQTIKKDKLSPQEFEKIVNYFEGKPNIQALITIALETLARPQELLWRTLNDVEDHGKYARITIGSHTKEGVKIVQCVDSYPYLKLWLDKHPNTKAQSSFLFTCYGKESTLGEQLTPFNVNKYLRRACKELGIDKPITMYSLKRCGVTFRRLRGDADWVIQKTACWNSTRQLATYDLSGQEDAFKEDLRRQGLLIDKDEKLFNPQTRTCVHCGTVNGYASDLCIKCRRAIRVNEIVNSMMEHEAMKRLLRIEEMLYIKS